jgi:hypothetical protein
MATDSAFCPARKHRFPARGLNLAGTRETAPRFSGTTIRHPYGRVCGRGKYGHVISGLVQRWYLGNGPLSTPLTSTTMNAHISHPHSIQFISKQAATGSMAPGMVDFALSRPTDLFDALVHFEKRFSGISQRVNDLVGLVFLISYFVSFR